MFGVWCLGSLGFGIWDLEFQVSGFGFRFSVFGCQVSGFGFRISGLGLEVSGLGYTPRGARFETAFSIWLFPNLVWSIGFGVEGPGFKV